MRPSVPRAAVLRHGAAAGPGDRDAQRCCLLPPEPPDPAIRSVPGAEVGRNRKCPYTDDAAASTRWRGARGCFTELPTVIAAGCCRVRLVLARLGSPERKVHHDHRLEGEGRPA